MFDLTSDLLLNKLFITLYENVGVFRLVLRARPGGCLKLNLALDKA